MYCKIIILNDLVKQNARAEVLRMLAQTPEYLSYAGAYQDDENFLLELIKINPKAMPFIKGSFLDDTDFINKATHRYTWAAKYASARLKDDPRFIRDSAERGFRANNATIKCASPRLLDDAEFVKHMARKHISIIASASPRLKYDRAFNLELIKINEDVFPHIARRFREDENFVLEAVSCGVEDISKTGKNLLNDKDFLLRVVQAGLTRLPYDEIADVLLEDEDFIRQLIQSGLRSIPYDYPIKTREFLEYLVSNNIDYSCQDIESSLFYDPAVLELLVCNLSYQALTVLSSKDFCDFFSQNSFYSFEFYQFMRMNKIQSFDRAFLESIFSSSENITELAVKLRHAAADRKVKIAELNITCLDRLGEWGIYLTEQRIKLANDQLDPDKPVVVVWQGRADHNGSLGQFNRFYPKLVKKNQVLFFEIASLLDIDQALLLLQTHLPKTIEQRTLVINAHGGQGSIDFGQDCLTPNLLEDIYGEILTKLNLNTLVLNSCSTGLGKEHKPNLANVFGRYIKTVFAPTIDSAIVAMKLDSAGEIVDVEYAGSKANSGEIKNIERRIEKIEKQLQTAPRSSRKYLLGEIDELKKEFDKLWAESDYIKNPIYKINSSEDLPYYDSDDFLNWLKHTNNIIFNNP